MKRATGKGGPSWAAFFVACAVALVPLGACRAQGEATAQDADEEPLTATALVQGEPCTPMTPDQTRRAELALSVLDAFPRHARIYDGAMDVFAHPWELGGEAPYCLPEDLLRRVAEALTRDEAWDYGLPGMVRLNMARQLGPRDPAIVADVARAAFYQGALADIAFPDLRPHARSVLASFGPAAEPWLAQALKEMDARDSMGTSAAQIAAASRRPEAVRAVARLLETSLAAEPPGALRRLRAKRLIELAYALGAAGPAAQPHVGLLTRLLARDVESFAPPFGVLEREPNEVCHALAMVGGPQAEAALRTPRCEKPWFVMPG